MLQDADQVTHGAARFGAGLRHDVGAAVRQLGAKRALVLSTPAQCDTALETAADLGELAAGIFAKALMHAPVEVTRDALLYAVDLKADCLVAVGGGSTTGLSKALAYRTGLPQVVIPTTYAGSEATPILGQTENGLKTTLSDPRGTPEIILYDPELVQGLPLDMTVTSGLNAMAHATEALYAPNRTADTDRRARLGLQAFADGLPKLITDPRNLEARLETQRGAWECGCLLGEVGMALHHKLCHTLGGSFGLPHAETHAIILPHAIAYNARSAARQLQPILDVFGGANAGAALHSFVCDIGAPLALKDLGLRNRDLAKAARLATQAPYPNPHPITETESLRLLQAAWAGDAPAF